MEFRIIDSSTKFPIEGKKQYFIGQFSRFTTEAYGCTFEKKYEFEWIEEILDSTCVLCAYEGDDLVGFCAVTV